MYSSKVADLIYAFAILVFLCAGTVVKAADIRGVVLDANGRGPLSRVRVRLEPGGIQGETNAKGQFAFANVAAGNYRILLETVGYRQASRNVQVTELPAEEVTIVLSADTERPEESVVVKEDPFEGAPLDGPSQTMVSGTELKNSDTVLLDDPLRAVASLPGVIAGNEYYATFSVRNAPFSQTGIYLDGVLTRTVIHTFGGSYDGESISLINENALDSVTLLPTAYSQEFGDSIGAALDMKTREGSRDTNLFRISSGMSDTNGVAEGPLGNAGKGSWLVAGRVGYLGYLLKRLGANGDETLSFRDGQTRLTYQLTPSNTISLEAIGGSGSYASGANAQTASTNAPFSSHAADALFLLNWRFTQGDRFLLSSTANYQDSTDDVLDPRSTTLSSSHYKEWTGNSQATWLENDRDTLQFGVSVRRTEDKGISELAVLEDAKFRAANHFTGAATLNDAYLEQTWNSSGSRVRLGAGLRWSRDNLVDQAPVLPHASFSFRLSESSKLELGWGQYAQFPEIDQIFAPVHDTRLLPQRATHYVAAVEHHFDRDTRLRIEAYDRDYRDVLATPFLFPRLVNNVLVWPSQAPQYFNSVRGYTRGVEVVLQRRSANRLNGWISYDLGYSRDRDSLTHTSYASDNDRRNAVNLYGSYRISPSVNLSARCTYGSGTPIPGYWSYLGSGNYTVSSVQNATRLSAYQRLDLRMNKSVVHEMWKMTWYAEVVNALNHKNERFMGIGGDFEQGAYPRYGYTLSILPSVGVSVDF